MYLRFAENRHVKIQKHERLFVFFRRFLRKMAKKRILIGIHMS